MLNLCRGILLLMIAALSATQLAAQSDEQWNEILNGAHRSDKHKARDAYRHPRQTLEFFGVKPSSTVVEIWPGGAAWYTEILAPLLKPSGKLYAAHFAVDAELGYFKTNRAKFDAMVAGNSDIYGALQTTTLMPPQHVAIAPAGSADFVLTFRNVHNWIYAETVEQVFKAMFTALKPGGVLGVVEHRAKAGTSLEDMIKSGYVTEAEVKRLAAQAGFKFVAASEVNANPKDTASHPKGVWTLPPSLRLGDEKRSEYLAIGESDRMTLKFVKPI